MPPTKKFEVTEIVRMDQDLADRIEAWRRKQSKIPNKSEAIRQLLDSGLVAEGIA